MNAHSSPTIGRRPIVVATLIADSPVNGKFALQCILDQSPVIALDVVRLISHLVFVTTICCSKLLSSGI